MSKGNQKILVTGATGFVGGAVINELEKSGNYEIYGLAGQRKVSEVPEYSSPIKIFPSDISNFQTLPKAEELKKTKVLIHTAGLAHQFGSSIKEDFWRVNVKGTENICRLAAEIGVEHFILISSVSVYGDYEEEIDETFALKPRGFYAESKSESENRAIDFCNKNGVPLTILRLATVIGEGDRGNTARLIRAIDRNRFIWIGSGKNKKSLIYKNDAAEGIMHAIQKKAEPGTEVYNLTAQAEPMKEIVEVIAGSLGRKIPRVKIPESAARGFCRLNNAKFTFEYLKNIERTIQKWLSNDIFSGDKFNKRFDFRPKTPISEALARQCAFYLNQRNEAE